MTPETRALIIRRSEGLAEELIANETRMLTHMNEHDRDASQQRLHRFTEALNAIKLKISMRQIIAAREASLRNKQ